MRLGRVIEVSIVASVSTMFSVASASAEALPRELASATAAYDRAQVEGDRSTLEELLASDYRLVNGGAQVESRSQFIAEFDVIKFQVGPIHRSAAACNCMGGRGCARGSCAHYRPRFR